MAKNDKRAEVKQLISLGKEKGYLTYEEVHDVLPPDVVSPEHMDALLTLLRGIVAQARRDGVLVGRRRLARGRPA